MPIWYGSKMDRDCYSQAAHRIRNSMEKVVPLGLRSL
jgi:hypothetical protein